MANITAKDDADAAEITQKNQKPLGDPDQGSDTAFSATVKSIDGFSVHGSVRGVIDPLSEIEMISRELAERADLLHEAQEVLKPRERPGRRGNLTRLRETVTLNWHPEGTEKFTETVFLVADEADFDILVGKSYTDFQGIFEDPNLDVYAFRLPWSRKTRGKLFLTPFFGPCWANPCFRAGRGGHETKGGGQKGEPGSS